MDPNPDSSLLIFAFSDDTGKTRETAFVDPEEVIVARTAEEVLPALRRVEEATRRGRWAAGCVSYEAAPAFDPAFAVREDGSGFPLLWFGVYDRPSPAPPPPDGDYAVSEWRPDIAPERYREAVGAVREAIARGETYQVNLTHRLRARFSGDDRAFWERLRRGQGAGFAAYLNLGRWRVLSASPELFFRREGTLIRTRPMKGTAPRGRWEEEDDQRAAALATSAKERAENIMIVDLLRNDLGRIAVPGSVRVPRLCEVERYPSVLQMTSTVEADVPPQASLADIFAALFPCGSITGAPKVRTMRHIAALEDSPRRAYCGAIGFVAPGGDAAFSVAIRTPLLDAETGELECGVGGGITWDSDAEREWRETETKAAFLHRSPPAFDLLETLLLENGVYALRQRHRERLLASARYFDFTVAPDALDAALDGYAAAHAGGEWRVRLIVSADGATRVEGAPLGKLPSPLCVRLARTPVSRDDPFLFHKTTNRALYEAHRGQNPDVDEVLLWNREGELCEFTTGNLILERDGARWTPPRDCGLLAGTRRDEMLERGELQERVLTLSDLRRADRLWYVNSVRGCIPVVLEERG